MSTFNFIIFFYYFFLLLVGWDFGSAATTGLLYQPQMIRDGDCGEIGGMKIDRGNRSTRRKPAPAPLLSITKSHMTRRGLNPGRRGGKPATTYFFLIWFLRLLALRPLLACCASLG
jgi:hypothetical protein